MEEGDGKKLRISTGRAHRKMPIVDFGQLPLQKAECMHVVLYNRTGIATPFSSPELFGGLKA